MKRSRSERIFEWVNLVLLTLLMFTMLYPFLYTFSISLSTTAEAMRKGLHLYPREVSLTSYSMVFKNEDILISYGNTLLRTVVGTSATIFISAMFAYPLSKKYMPNRRIYAFLLLFTMLFSGGIIPTYLLIKNLGLLNNRLVYILPSIISAYNVIVIRSFFESIPESLTESAKIDGANEFTIFLKIVLPLSKPVLATVGLWSAVAHWNAWFDSMLYMTDKSKQVLQTVLQRIITESNVTLIQQGIVNPDTTQFTPETMKSATIIVSILPILMVYPFIQRYFVKGIMLGSVKG